MKKTVIFLLIIFSAFATISAQENTHEYLITHNAIYQANYKKATELSDNKARTTCAKISKERKLTENESKAYLMAVYFSFTNMPQLWTIKAKKAFLGTYYKNASYNNKPAGQINTEFAKMMKKMKAEMQTKDLSGLPMPVYVSEEDQNIAIDKL